MTEVRRLLGELAPIAAQTLPVWTPAAIAVLFFVVWASLSLAYAVYAGGES